eukprot:203553-Lingulodinium_polyedra.AAC.1
MSAIENRSKQWTRPKTPRAKRPPLQRDGMRARSFQGTQLRRAKSRKQHAVEQPEVECEGGRQR